MDSNKKPSRKEEAASTDAKKQPAKVLRIEDVSVSVFRHERQGGAANYSCNFQRSYKDSTGQWKRTQWFGLDELGLLISLAEQAAAWIREQLDRQDA